VHLPDRGGMRNADKPNDRQEKPDDRPPAPHQQQLDEIETRAAHLHEYATTLVHEAQLDQLAGTDVPALLAEIRRLRSELAEAAEDMSWLRCLEAAGVDNWEGIETAIDMRGE
jgi:uncharacterized protein with von Willebrand factor type A (vWA) domain